jgi:hypothetical protein
MRGTEVAAVQPGGGGEDDVLGAFVASTRPWGRAQVPLAPEVTAAVWAISVVDVLAGAWAVTVLVAGWSCAGFLCSLSTWGGRPVLLLGLTGGCVLATIVLAVLTGGLTRAGGGQLAALVLTAVVGVVAVISTVLALGLAALAVAVGVAVVMGFIVAVERS